MRTWLEIEMWQQFWHDAVRTLGPVYFGFAIVFVLNTVIRSRLEVRSKAQSILEGATRWPASNVVKDYPIRRATRTEIVAAVKEKCDRMA